MTIEFAKFIEPQFIYVLLSAVVAVLIWIEGQMLRKSEGKMLSSLLFQISSVADTLWFFVTMIAMYMIDFQSLTLAVPIAYSIYTMAGWIYGSRLLHRHGIPDKPENIVIPKSYIAFSQSFSIIFFVLCLFVLLFSGLPLAH